MDERLAAINERVAAAADAWLAEPLDGTVYQRLLVAITARRAYLQPPLPGQEPDLDPPVPTPTVLQDAEILDELADAPGGARPFGELLDGDPGTVLGRLRGQS